MTFSLCWSYINARHFKTPIDIWGNFVPGMIFFQSIFGYLVFCIVYKWSVDWVAIGEPAPSLLNMLIYMFLSPGTIETPLYKGQATIQIILLLMALVCVPILLFLKPFYLRHVHNKARAQGYRGIGENSRVSALDDEDDEGSGSGTLTGGRDSVGDDEDGAALITQDIGHGDGEHEEFEFSEEMIHQVIHTIGMLMSLLRFQVPTNNCSRILSQLCLSHSILPPSLGSFPSPSTAFHCPLENDTQHCFWYDRCHRCHCRRLSFLPLVCTHCYGPLCYGRYQRYVAFATFALG
jgi:hypothetical protein